jgi:hypothetical protein
MTITRDYIRTFFFPVTAYLVLAILLIFKTEGSLFFEAVSFDLIISIPLFYLIAARKFNTRLLLVFPMMAFGFVLSKLLLPTQTHFMIHFLKWIAPVLELISLATIFYYAFRFIKAASQDEEEDFFSAIKNATQKIAGINWFSNILATEFSMMYYSFVGWWKKTPKNYPFTCYQTNNSRMIYGFLIFILVAETAVTHLLFIKLSPVIAWSILALSIYFVIQIVAHVQAMRLRVTNISSVLHLRYGLFVDEKISLNQIQQVISTSNYSDTKKQIISIGLLKSLEPYTIAIELKEPIQLSMIYGIKKKGNVLLVPIDHPSEFIQQIKQSLSITRSIS